MTMIKFLAETNEAPPESMDESKEILFSKILESFFSDSEKKKKKGYLSVQYTNEDIEDLERLRAEEFGSDSNSDEEEIIKLGIPIPEQPGTPMSGSVSINK